jgi:hypothetical protein
MPTRAPTRPHLGHDHRPQRLLDRRILGISGRYWVIAGIALGFCFSIYELRNPITPNAFDRPAAQIPNQLRSPWGVKNPL